MRRKGQSEPRPWDGSTPLQLITVSDRRSASDAGPRWAWLGLVPLVAAAGGGGWLLGRAMAPVKETIVTVTIPATTLHPTTTTTLARTTTTVAPTTTTTLAPTTTTAVPTTTAAPAPTTTTLAPIPVPAGPVLPTVATLAEGRLTLRGSVSTAALRDAIVARAGALFGADHVANELVLDPRATARDGGPVLLTELVRFVAGSVEIPPESLPMLDGVGALLLSTPAALVVVSSYTDDQGDPLRNVGLAAQRIDALAGRWAEKGIRPEQVIRDARGGADPIADNTTVEGQNQNRRLSLTLYNLL